MDRLRGCKRGVELGNQDESHIEDNRENRGLGPGLLGLKKEGALDSTPGSHPA